MMALSVLSLRNNMLGTKEAGDVLGELLKGNSGLKELDVSENMYLDGSQQDRSISSWKTDLGFVQEISNGLAGNGTMTSLNLSGNRLGAEGTKLRITDGIKVSAYVWLERSFWHHLHECPSGHGFDCCCLLLFTGQWGYGDVEPACWRQ
jgi:hypothetical protein